MLTYIESMGPYPSRKHVATVNHDPPPPSLSRRRPTTSFVLPVERSSPPSRTAGPVPSCGNTARSYPAKSRIAGEAAPASPSGPTNPAPPRAPRSPPPPLLLRPPGLTPEGRPARDTPPGGLRCGPRFWKAEGRPDEFCREHFGEKKGNKEYQNNSSDSSHNNNIPRHSLFRVNACFVLYLLPVLIMYLVPTPFCQTSKRGFL